MLPIDVTFDTGEKTERGRKQKNVVKDNNCSKEKYCRHSHQSLLLGTNMIFTD